MNAKRITPSKAYFEFFQINKKVEVKVIIPCEIFQIFFDQQNQLIDEIPNVISTGFFFDYVKENLILLGSKGSRFDLAEIVKIGKDDGTNMMAFNMVFNSKNKSVQNVVNTFLFDVNELHVNSHKIAEDEFIVTSVDDEIFAFPQRRNTQMIWTIVFILALMIIAFLIYMVKS